VCDVEGLAKVKPGINRGDDEGLLVADGAEEERSGDGGNSEVHNPTDGDGLKGMLVLD
jgi:hypothetical protein